MSENLAGRVTVFLNTTVTAVQVGIALLLVVVLLVGLVNLLATFATSAMRFELLGYQNAIALISTTIEIVLYLFIVIELYETIVAYVEAKSVVRAVVHAGLIAVVRQIIIFKPGEAASTRDALLQSFTFLVLLTGLLLGFFLVHRMEDDLDGTH